jgi:hypothetical protein
MQMEEGQKSAHDRVARFIAEHRFPFPGQTDWPADYRTVVNAGNPQAAARFGSHLHYPDILVVDGRGAPSEVGEVEMRIRPEIAPRLTLASRMAPVIPDSGVWHFFLYVPIEEGERALEFLRTYRISYAGLRTFEIDAEGRIRINAVHTPGHAKDHRET